MPNAIVLAAGLSSRMGAENKLLLKYKNKSVIATVVETILNAGLENLIVVTGHERALIEHELAAYPVQYTYNKRYAEGMTTSIQQGVKASNGNGYMICLSDMVTLSAPEYRFIIEAFEQRISIDAACICLPRYNNEKGNPVIFSASHKDAILKNKEPEGCKNIVQLNKDHVYMIDMETSHILQDFDYPEDYSKLASV